MIYKYIKNVENKLIRTKLNLEKEVLSLQNQIILIDSYIKDMNRLKDNPNSCKNCGSLDIRRRLDGSIFCKICGNDTKKRKS
jgi:hypothetical protein